MHKYCILFLAVVVLSFMAVPMPVQAQHGQSGSFSNVFVTHAYEAVGSTEGVVKAITPGIIDTTYPNASLRAYVFVATQGIRFTCDGTTPTTSVGNPIPAGSVIELLGLLDIQNFQFINDDDTGTATCHVNLQYEAEMK
jgi:hypothetical protein